MNVFRDARARLLLWGALGAAAGAAWRALWGVSLDGPYFAVVAHRFVHGAWLHTYADGGFQAGPWQLLTSLLLGSGMRLAVISGAASAVAVVLLLRRFCAAAELPTPAWTEAAVMALAVGWGVVTGVYSSGHPAEFAIPAMWALAALAARDGRSVVAGLMLGLSVGWETWGVLGLPLVLLLPDLRRMLVAGATALAAAAAAYLPFVLVGPFRMGSYAWLVAPQSFVHALLGVHSFSWRDRLLQAVVVGVVALVAIAIARWRSAAPAVTATVVVAVTVFAKVLMDPQTRNYYWLPIQVLLLTGIAALWRREPLAAVAAAPALAVAVIAPLQTWPVELVALVALVAGIGLAPGRLVRPDPLRPPLLPDAEPALTG